MVEFASMTTADARGYLERFTAEMQPALQRLADHATATGGPSADELDLSPASLDPLWEWAVHRLAWRSGYVAPEPGRPGPRIAAAEIEPADQLPSWFHHPSAAGYARFSAATLWLVDGLGRYLGATVVRTLPGTNWAVGDSRVAGYVYQNHPVVRGLIDEEDPIYSCAVAVEKSLRAVSRGPQSLHAFYNIWAARPPR